MKEQRQAIKAAAAVDANLGEIQSPSSRFIDAGFVNTGGRDVDWAGKFLNAAKAGADAYHATDSYQQQLRNDKTDAVRSAINWTKESVERAKEQQIPNENLGNFFLDEMNEAVGRLAPDREDSEQSKAWKDTFFGVVNDKYSSLANAAHAKYRLGNSKKSEDQVVSDMSSGVYTSLDKVKGFLITTHSNKEISNIWMKGATTRVSRLANDFEEDYNEYLKVDEAVRRDILVKIKASGKPAHIYLEERDMSMADLMEEEMMRLGVESPFDVFVETIEGYKNQEGTDGVGKLIDLGNTNSKALLASIKGAEAKVQGFAYSNIIKNNLSNGLGDISSDLDKYATTSAIENTAIKRRVDKAVIENVTNNFLTVLNPDSDDSTRLASAKWLDSFILKNPEYVATGITPFVNELNYKWKTALDATSPAEVTSFLREMDTTLWDNNIGSVTRNQILKAAGPEMERAIIAHRAGVSPLHIAVLSRGDLPKSTQEDYKRELGADSYIELKTSYQEQVRKSLPYASPMEIEQMTNMALDFDRWGIGVDKQKFFDIYADNMYHSAATPTSDMAAGEPDIIKDWFNNMKVPTTGTWKEINSLDAQQPGWTQGVLHHMIANTSDELRNQIAAGLGMDYSMVDYMSEGKPTGGFYQFDFAEGFVDEWQPPEIKRWGKNEWSINLKAGGWSDASYTFTLSNEELREANNAFAKHYKRYNIPAKQEGVKEALEQEKYDKQQELNRKHFEEQTGYKGWESISDWFTFPWNKEKEEK